jgi:hypothetical protein
VGDFHQIPCKFNGKRAGILWNHQAKGAGQPPWPPCDKAETRIHSREHHAGETGREQQESSSTGTRTGAQRQQIGGQGTGWQ